VNSETPLRAEELKGESQNSHWAEFTTVFRVRTPYYVTVTVRYGYDAGKVIFYLTGQIHKFSLKPKIGCYRQAYCRQNIRTVP